MEMRSAVCECGRVMTGEDDLAVAHQVRGHIMEAHPDKLVPPLEDARIAVGKARMYGEKARATFILRPKDRSPRS
jgi:hypothetical protein